MEKTSTIKDIESLKSVINTFLNSDPRYSFQVQNYRKDNITSREVTSLKHKLPTTSLL